MDQGAQGTPKTQRTTTGDKKGPTYVEQDDMRETAAATAATVAAAPTESGHAQRRVQVSAHVLTHRCMLTDH